MNKADVINHMSAQADITKAAANRALDALIEAVSNSLKRREDVALIGFGTFSTSDRKERQGRNPRTGEVITIPAATVPRFKPGSQLKKEVNK